mmetsp:Transcript_15173/g.18472  ORF Transcript_15173/g.18472 Transcript_15173/m.18472 type:complete len:101 (-) Transcript_15173:13-315(-)
MKKMINFLFSVGNQNVVLTLKNLFYSLPSFYWDEEILLSHMSHSSSSLSPSPPLPGTSSRGRLQLLMALDIVFIEKVEYLMVVEVVEMAEVRIPIEIKYN